MTAFDVIFFRHGIADDSSPDQNRALTEEGVRKTRAAAEGLRKLAPPVFRIFTSPWLRAVQTAEVLSNVMELPAAQELPELAGDRSVEDLLKSLRSRNGANMILVGHQPLLGEAIAALLGASGKCEIDLRKSGACSITVDGFPSRRPAVLNWLLTSKQLRAASK